MKFSNQTTDDFSRVLDLLVRLAIVTALLIWSFQILKPFLMMMIWGTILAIATAPVCGTLSDWLSGRRTLAAVLTSLALLLLLLVPSFFLADSLLGGISLVRENWEQGTFQIPPPTDQVKELPLIGEKVYHYWFVASTHLDQLLLPLAPYLKTAGRLILDTAKGVGLAVIQIIFSIIISGVMLAKLDRFKLAMASIARRLNATRGDELLEEAIVTVRSVTRGILGVAFLQAVLTGIGLGVAGIPGAGLWTLLALVCGIIQIGVGPILLLAVFYLFSTATTTKAVLFLLWALLIIPLDNILKPLLLGKGTSVPMLVIFLGALGGFVKSGLIGLFVGAVVLSLAYKLFLAWVSESPPQEEDSSRTLAKNV